MDSDYIPKQAPFAEQHKKRVSSNGNLCPKGERKEMYDLGWLLAFNKIDFEEYARRRRRIKAKYSNV